MEKFRDVVIECSFMKLCVCSYNCLSLVESKKSFEKGLDVAGRLSYLRTQCMAQNVSVLGLQETRTDDGSYTSGDFIVVASGCSLQSGTRSLGLEIWINTRAWFCVNAEGVQKSVKLNYKDVLKMHATPRVLLVS